MAFPNTATPTGTSVGTASTTHDVLMPATVNSGDLLLVVICTETGASASPQQSTPIGWTQEVNNVYTSISNNELGVYSRVADGTEDGATVNFATTNAAVAAANAYRITDWFGSLAGVEVTAPPVTANTTTPNPPNFIPSWASEAAEDTLWIAAATGTDDDATLNSAPSNYTGGLGTVSGGGSNNGCGVYTAHRQLNMPAENPSIFIISQTEATQAVTIAVRQFVGPILTAESGGYTVIGNAASTRVGHRMTAEAGSYVLTGQAAATRVGHRMVAESGSYVLTGNDALFRLGLTLAAEAGSYSITGQAVQTSVGKRLTAVAGSLDLTGYDARFRLPLWRILPAKPKEVWASVSSGGDEVWSPINTGDGNTWQ